MLYVLTVRREKDLYKKCGSVLLALSMSVYANWRSHPLHRTVVDPYHVMLLDFSPAENKQRIQSLRSVVYLSLCSVMIYCAGFTVVADFELCYSKPVLGAGGVI